MNWPVLFSDGTTADWVLLAAFHSLWLSVVGLMIVRIQMLRAPAVRSAWCTFFIILLLFLPLIIWLVPRPTHPVQAAPIAMISLVTEVEAPLLNNVLGMKTVVPGPNAEWWKTWINGLGLLWLAVTLLLIGRLLYGLAFLKGYCNCLREIVDGRLSVILRGINETFDFRRKPRFFVSLTIPSPVSIGISKPIVILPAGLYQSVADEELRAILMHELAHIHNFDHIVGLLERLVKAIYWWNPFVYLVCNALTAAREEVSDNYGIRAMGSATKYAMLLVRLVEEAPPIGRLPCVAGMATPYQCLQTRIWNIMSRKRDLRVKTSKGTISAISASAMLMCGLIGLGSQVKIFGTEQAVASEKSKPKEAAIETFQPHVGVHAPRIAGPAVEVPSASQSSPIRLEAAQRNNAAIAPFHDLVVVPNTRMQNLARSDTFPAMRNEGADVPQATPIQLNGSSTPIVRSKVEPEYPSAAKQQKIFGTVQIAVVVNEKGDVYEGKVAMGHPLLHKPALNASLQWKFEPIWVDGAPRAFVTIIDFHF